MNQLKLFSSKFRILIKGKPMHNSDGKVYLFDSEKEAKKMVDICYGLSRLNNTIEIEEVAERQLN